MEAVLGHNGIATDRSTGGPRIPPSCTTTEGGEGGGANRSVSGSKMCHPQPSKLPMHLREERHRGRVLRTSTNYLEKPVIQPRGLGTRWKSPLEPYPLSGPGKHSRDSGSDSGIATAVAAAQPNLLPQKAPAHPPMQRSTSGHREEHQGYCWYAPCRGSSTFHWQLNWFWSARGVMVPRGLVPWRVCHHCNPQTTRATT